MSNGMVVVLAVLVFAMVTLAVASVFAILASQLSDITGGEDGRSFRVPEILRPGTVLCGGDLTSPQWVTEQYLLDLEFEENAKLVQNPKTQERMMAILQGGKPLRN